VFLLYDARNQLILVNERFYATKDEEEDEENREILEPSELHEFPKPWSITDRYIKNVKENYE